METKTNTHNIRSNRFTGESIQLTDEEAKKHDELFVAEMLATADDKLQGTGGSRHWDTVRKNLDWFRKNNAKAYMVLLDQQRAGSTLMRCTLYNPGPGLRPDPGVPEQ